jgi:hypothetical protein
MPPPVFSASGSRTQPNTSFLMDRRLHTVEESPFAEIGIPYHAFARFTQGSDSRYGA